MNNRFLLLPLGLAATLVLAGCPQQQTGGGAQESPAATATAPAATQGTNGTMTTGTAQGAVLDRHPEAPAVQVKVTKKGFEPKAIPAKKGQPLAIEFTRTEEKTCATEAVFDDLGGLQVDLPLNQPVRVSFTPEKSGKLKYGCEMGRMIAAHIDVSE